VPEDIDSHTIHVRRLGTASKQAIVLIHGIGVSSDYYFPFAYMLQDDFDVHAIDLPGYGKTPKPPRPLTIRELSRIVAKYVEKHSLTHPILVGQSMGAQIVAHTAENIEDVYGGLLLIAPTSNRKERHLIVQGIRLLQDILREPPRANMLVLVNYLRMGVYRYLFTAVDMVRDHLERTLSNVTAPVLVVYGTRDKVSPKDWADYLAKVAVNGDVLAVDGSPHLVQLDTPKTLAAITKRFASQL
jgi:pimeloyl-ACP methyl ester carboxylesterase